MKKLMNPALRAAVLGLGLVGSASAAEIFVTTNISTSETWTANNTYNLQGQIYVLPGASLTIEPGTIVASTTNGGGSLAVTRGAQIFVQGTATQPVIMTSKADQATWVGGNPKTGVWREGVNEWGNLTVMGGAYISENLASFGNTAFPDPGNEAQMEGLVNGAATDYYGGGNDDDDSGSISYLSLRYGGKVIGLNNELNGLSLGGVGRETEIDHVDIMNNVDDGIEIWGGTVNLKYFNIWNIGDDSVDIDQGYRGKMQFGLIVQGYAADAAQGSGVGDNVFETDGAEQSDYQPVTTTTIYNVTVIGQPSDGDHGAAFRDGARVQYRNCIFMEIGEAVVKNDNVDGDGGLGYGHNGTLTFTQTWMTDYNAVPAHANDAPLALGGWAGYPAQSSGKLSEIKDSVFFGNLHGTAYTEATAQGVFAATNDNVKEPALSPIVSIARGPSVVKGGKTMKPVISLDPRPANDALASIGSAPNDGFFTPASYRGAFAPGATGNWLNGWTAADAFGFNDKVNASFSVRSDALNVPNSLTTNGLPTIGNSGFALVANNPTAGCGVVPGSFAFVGVSLVPPITFPLAGWGCSGGFGMLLINPNTLTTLVAPYFGAPASLPLPIPSGSGLYGLPVYTQVVFFTPSAALRAGDAVDLVLGE